MSRKCIYTNKEAKSKDRVIPKSKIGDELHNWCNFVPVSSGYKDIKKDNMPDELEMQANELFKMLEMAKLRVVYFEEKLKEVQEKLKPRVKTEEKEEEKKERQIKQAFHEKAVVEVHEESIAEILNKRKKKVLFG